MACSPAASLSPALSSNTTWTPRAAITPPSAASPPANTALPDAAPFAAPAPPSSIIENAASLTAQISVSPDLTPFCWMLLAVDPPGRAQRRNVNCCTPVWSPAISFGS